MMLGATKIMNSFHIVARIHNFFSCKEALFGKLAVFLFGKLAGLGSGVVDTVNLLTIYVLN